MKNKTILKAAMKEKIKLVNFKASVEDINKIKNMARKYFNGNLSGWIRYCSMNYRPKKDEIA